MRIIHLVFILPSCVILAEDNTFRARPPKLGEQSIRIKQITSKSSEKVDLREFARTTSTYQEILEIVEAVNDDRVSRMKVSYGRTNFSETGTALATISPMCERLKGKTFIVERGPEKITATFEGDEKLHRAIREEVEMDYEHLLYARSFAKLLEGKVPSLGQAFELPVNCVREIFPMSDDVQRQVVFTFKETREHNGERCGAFDLKAKFSAPKKAQLDEIESEMSGEILVGMETCCIVAVKMEAIYKRGFSSLQASVSGNMKWSVDIKRRQ